MQTEHENLENAVADLSAAPILLKQQKAEPVLRALVECLKAQQAEIEALKVAAGLSRDA